MDRKEFRVLIKHCFLIMLKPNSGLILLKPNSGLILLKPNSGLISIMGSATGKSTIIGWYAQFKCGPTSTDDTKRSDRPKSAVVPIITNKVILKDRKMKLRETADTLKISEGSVFTILHEHLGMRKLLSKWVLRLFTRNQKQQRIDDSERFLSEIKTFLHRNVTMDETWIHHYTPDSKRSSAEWKAADKSGSKRPKPQKSAGKIMVSVFWDEHGILFIDYLEKGKTINSEYYMALLDRLSAEIKKERPHMQKKKVFFTTPQLFVDLENLLLHGCDRKGLPDFKRKTIRKRKRHVTLMENPHDLLNV
ncbi:Histone-lysine N-methyltransferase SETMAR like protein [Argiope bruennichi]|uniref:Histone-lysine N-methyltransferase SETMAR like protein n=1 Tax=Argiope bruennichi TaxID=94029 RepID=A0A8T0FGI3_ARGBR|nr:Histone-lysine N-methyltransferase SETMAR like protein [Argiope bruennichi]